MNDMKKILWMMLVAIASYAANAQQLPFVYDVEYTGRTLAAPVMPDTAMLPVINELTDASEGVSSFAA